MAAKPMANGRPIGNGADRPLPHSVQLERDVLGTVLLDAGVPGVIEAIRRLRPEHFFFQPHRYIWQRLKQQIERGYQPDLAILTDDLCQHRELEQIPGGAAYVSALIDGIPRFNPQIGRWVEVLEQKELLRRYAALGSHITELALGANGNGEDVIQEIAALSIHLNHSSRNAVETKRILVRSAREIAQITAEAVPWIIPGFVAAGALTDLSANVKMGKTELITRAVRAVLEGVPFLGKPTTQGQVLYLTEQPLVSFRQALGRAALLNTDLLVISHGDTRGIDWPAIAAEAIRVCKDTGAILLIVDTLPQFAGLKGDEENDAGAALEAMRPLQLAAHEGIGVLFTRHDRKSGGDVGDSGRGSSAFSGAADILLSLRRPDGNQRKTLRLLQGLSRFSETPQELLIELTDNGYESRGEPDKAAFEETKQWLLSSAPIGESEAVALKDLIAGSKYPRASVHRAAEELHQQGMLNRIGRGKRGEPFRYFRAANEGDRVN